MDELLKVRKYLKGIEAPEMTAAVAAVKALPSICLNFDLTPDFLTGFLTQNSPSVQVASVTHDGRGRDNRRDRDSGRGRGREARRGRGHSRGRGSGRERGYKTQRAGGAGTFQGTVTDKSNFPDEYASFSPENMQQLFEIRVARDSAIGVSAVATTQVAVAATSAPNDQLAAVNPGNTSQHGAAAVAVNG